MAFESASSSTRGSFCGRQLRLKILALGLTAPWVQFALLRELMGSYGGNEYLIGLALGSWLLFGGLASALARWCPPHAGCLSVGERWLWALLAVFPLLTILALRSARHTLFLAGGGLGLSAQLTVATLAQIPFCSLSAFFLVRNTQRLALNEREFGISQSYLLDAVGSLIGGVLFAFVLSRWLGHLQTSALVAVALVSAALADPLPALRKLMDVRFAWIALAVLALVVGAFMERPSLSWLIPAGKLVFEGRSPYGQIIVSELGGQRTYFRNGAPMFSTDTPESVEQFVHLPLLAHPAPKHVLVIGPPRRDVLVAIQQHGVADVTFVQPDPALEAALSDRGDFASGTHVHVVLDDARNFLARYRSEIDVILVDEALPTTLLANRYFTREFARTARDALKSGGVIALPLGEYTEYFDAPRAQLIASVSRAFGAEFHHVRLLPSDLILLLASDRPLATDLAGAFAQRNLRTVYVRPSFLAATVAAPDRIAALERAQSAHAPENADFFPIANHFALRRWLREYGFRFGLLEAGLLVILFMYAWRMRRLQWPVFATGFSASGLEYLALAAVQTVAGTLYYLSALLITLFMAGLAIGVRATRRVDALHRALLISLLSNAALAAAHAVIVVALPFICNSMASRPHLSQLRIWLVEWLFAGELLALGAATGAVFALCSRIAEQELTARASQLYSADFVGGALGAVLFATLFVPALGMMIPAAVCGLFLASTAFFVAAPRQVARSSESL
jgi:spermidine synthase